MPETTERVLEFATEAFRRHVGDLLDDPSWLLDEDDPAGYMAEQRLISEDLGIDFDCLITELGTEYEINRLRGYEAVRAPAGQRP